MITKTANDHEQPQISINDHKPPANDHKPLANNHKTPANNYKLPENNHKLPANDHKHSSQDIKPKDWHFFFFPCPVITMTTPILKNIDNQWLETDSYFYSTCEKQDK